MQYNRCLLFFHEKTKRSTPDWLVAILQVGMQGSRFSLPAIFLFSKMALKIHGRRRKTYGGLGMGHYYESSLEVALLIALKRHWLELATWPQLTE